MKFIIRDDDVNYHFNADTLYQYYSRLIEYCPITICAVPFIRGNFFKWTNIFERREYYNIEEFLQDSTVYPLGNNCELVSYLNSIISRYSCQIALHGINHQNLYFDNNTNSNRNYLERAEFYSGNDFSTELLSAKNYFEQLFALRINWITPPQNIISLPVIKQCRSIGLNICADYNLVRSINASVDLLGYRQYFDLLLRKYNHRNFLYPYPLSISNIKYICQYRLYPSSDLNYLKSALDYVNQIGGVFVLGTHSYAFDYKMINYNMTMKEALLELIEYSSKYSNIHFCTLNSL